MNYPGAMAGLWAGLNGAQVFENGTYFDPGVYDVEIVRALSKDTQKSGLAFIVETEVLTSTNPAHPTGSKRTWYQSMKNRNVAFGSIAGFLLAVFGLKNDDARKHDFFPYLEAFMGRVTGPENVLSGLYVHLQCTMIQTQVKVDKNGNTSGGTDFTRHDWSPFDYEAARSVGLQLDFPRWGDYTRALPSPSGPPVRISEDGKWRLDEATNAWVPHTPPGPPPPPPPPPATRPARPLGAPPPPPPPPPGPPKAHHLQQGTEYSSDGVWYLPPGSNTWIAMPPGARPPGR